MPVDQEMDLDFLGVDLDGIPDQEVLPGNTEAEVEVIRAEPGHNAEGKPWLRLTLRVVNVPEMDDFQPANYFPFNHFLAYPSDLDDAEARIFKGRRLKQFYEAFEAPQPATSPDAFIGLRGKVILEVESSEEYGDRNRIRRVLSKGK